MGAKVKEMQPTFELRNQLKGTNKRAKILSTKSKVVQIERKCKFICNFPSESTFDALFHIIGLIDQVVAVGLEREGVAEGFVEGALPPLGEVVGIPAKTCRGELMAAEIDEADLLAFHRKEGAMAVGRSEETVIGIQDAFDMHVAVVAHE